MSMPLFKRFPPVPMAALAAALAVAGCGGGGGGDSGGGGGALVTAGAALTTANQIVAAREGLSAGEVLVDTGTAAVFGAQVFDAGRMMAIVRGRVASIDGALARAPNAVGGAVTTGTEQCSGGGRVDFAVDDVNNNVQIDAGDRVDYVFVGCVEDGTTIDGRMSVVAAAFSRTSPTAFTVVANVTLNGFSVSTPTGSGRLDGTMQVAQTQFATNDLELRLAASSLQSQVTYAGVTTTRRYETFQTVDRVRPTAAGVSETITHVGTLYSSVLGDRPILVSTESSLVRNDPNRFPNQGTVLLTGGAGASGRSSQLRVTALSETQVRVQLDSDGDGTYESSTERPWTDLG